MLLGSVKNRGRHSLTEDRGEEPCLPRLLEYCDILSAFLDVFVLKVDLAPIVRSREQDLPSCQSGQARSDRFESVGAALAPLR